MGDLLRTWSLPLAPLITLSIALVLYLRGWIHGANYTRTGAAGVARALFCGGGGFAVACVGLTD